MNKVPENLSWSGLNLPTLVHLLRWRAVHEPNRNAFVFLRNGTREEGQLTYGMLDQKARCIAHFLMKQYHPGERALLVFPAGLEFISAFFGCLYANIIPVPTPSPDPVRLKRTLPRLRAIAKNAQPSVILSTSKIFLDIQDMSDPIIDLGDVAWSLTDTLEFEEGDIWEGAEITQDSIALLQYTSGSTNEPKGVMVSHANLMHQFESQTKAGAFSPNSVSLTWMPHFHDYGLVSGLLHPVYVGCPAYVMSTLVFLKRPIRWLEAISRLQVTHTGGPNFAYESCIRNSTPEQRAWLNLQAWDVASCGAEPIRTDTMERFCDLFLPAGFRREAFVPCYGLAESTLLVSSKGHGEVPSVCFLDQDALERGCVVESHSSQKRTKPMLGSGSPIEGMDLVIVHPEERVPCVPDQIGEVWIAGPSISKGYWNRDEESKETFQAFLQDSGKGPFLRTGDLGFVRNGQLYITGRLKDLIIIHGTNHYPQDIELTVEGCNPALRVGAGVAFSFIQDGDERLVITQELERRERAGNLNELASTIREAVADRHNLQAFAILFLRAGSIPKTTSGKVRREACKQAYLAGELHVLDSNVVGAGNSDQTPPADKAVLGTMHSHPTFRELEALINGEVSRLLRVADGQFVRKEPLRSLGFDSLMAVELKNRLETHLRISISLKDILLGPTIGELTNQLLLEHPGLSVANISAFMTPRLEEKWEEGEI